MKIKHVILVIHAEFQHYANITRLIREVIQRLQEGKHELEAMFND